MSSNHDYVDVEYQVLDSKVKRRRFARIRRRLLPLVTVLIFVLTKLKVVLAAIKAVPLLGTGISALLSVGAYALWFGWELSALFVLLIFIHEMGHVLALRYYGVKATAPMFIPFMGAFIGMKQLPRNAVAEANIGIGGPILGSLGGIAIWGLFLITGHVVFLVAAYLAIVINLFNLLPVLPLDGGRIVGAVSHWIWILGFVAVVALTILWRNPVMLVILLMGGPEAWQALKRRKDQYYHVPRVQRIFITLAYLVLIALLVWMYSILAPQVVEHKP